MTTPVRSLVGGRRGAFVLVGLVLVVVAVVAAWFARWPMAVTAVAGAFTVVLVLVAHADRGVGRVSGRMDRLAPIHAEVAALSRDTAVVAAGIDALVTSVDRLGERIQQVDDAWAGATAEHEALLHRVLERIDRSASELMRDLAALVDERGSEPSSAQGELSDGLRSMFDRQRRLLDRLGHEPVTEIDALLQVHRRLQLDDPLPLMGGWALSPRGVLRAMDVATNEQCRLVVECGSGASTLFLARALQLRGDPSLKLIALEHDEQYAQQTSQLLTRHGLQHMAEVRLAPLIEVEVDGNTQLWYDVASFDDLQDIDFLLVDGPPGGTGAHARAPAYPLLAERLRPGATLMLDDARRPDEKAILTRWLASGRLEQELAEGAHVILRVLQ